MHDTMLNVGCSLIVIAVIIGVSSLISMFIDWVDEREHTARIWSGILATVALVGLGLVVLA